MHHSTKKLDLASQRFGKLTALAPAAGQRGGAGATTSMRESRGLGQVSIVYMGGACVEMIAASTV